MGVRATRQTSGATVVSSGEGYLGRGVRVRGVTLPMVWCHLCSPPSRDQAYGRIFGQTSIKPNVAPGVGALRGRCGWATRHRLSAPR
jgi:hypothetical protein